MEVRLFSSVEQISDLLFIRDGHEPLVSNETAFSNRACPYCRSNDNNRDTLLFFLWRGGKWK